MEKLYYCVNKKTKDILSYGLLPNTWGTITGMADLSAEDVGDLSWAGYPDHCFLSEDIDLPAQGYSLEALNSVKAIRDNNQAILVRSDRNNKLAATDWVVTKAYELGQPIPENYRVYRQSLRDITSHEGFPWDIPIIIEP